MAKAILDQLHSMQLNDIQVKFIEYIKEICPIKETGNVFLGDYDRPRESNDMSLRKVYNKTPATAFEKIVNNTIADCCPNEKALHLHYTNKQLQIDNLSECTGQCNLPCNNICILNNLIKTGRTEFEFSIPDLKTISEVVGRKKPTAPGRNKITYRDISYSDPEYLITHRIITQCVHTQNIPASWKSYDTTMIPKPMKQGHYSEVSSWRPIALLDSSYKIYTTALCNELKRWCDVNNLMHPMQKSLGPADGCAEHNFVLISLSLNTTETLLKPL